MQIYQASSHRLCGPKVEVVMFYSWFLFLFLNAILVKFDGFEFWCLNLGIIAQTSPGLYDYCKQHLSGLENYTCLPSFNMFGNKNAQFADIS